MSESDWTPEKARDAARSGHRSIAQGLIEEWDNIHEVDQHIAEWKRNMAEVGINLDNEDTLWVAAIMVERIYALVLANMEGCPYGGHLVDHMNYGLAPLILAIDSSITRVEGGADGLA
jgi:hypothetical protein